MRKYLTKNGNKGFTLVELLTVIIVLGFLIIIIFPKVLNYISRSKENTYITIANSYVSEVTNKIVDATLPLYDENATYYIPSSCISVENGEYSPYGKIVELYVVVVYDGTGYDYYFTSRDDANRGIYLTYFNSLKDESIKKDVKEIPVDIAIGGREKILLLDDSCDVLNATLKKPNINIEEKKSLNGLVTNYYDQLVKNNKIFGAVKKEDYISLDGVDDYIDLGFENFDPNEGFMFSIKMRLNSYKDSSLKNEEVEQSILGNWESGGGGILIDSENNLAANWFLGNSFKFLEGKKLELDKWYNISYTYDRASLSLYIDGKLVDRKTYEGTLKKSALPLLIGANPSENKNFERFANIDVESVAIYNNYILKEYIDFKTQK